VTRRVDPRTSIKFWKNVCTREITILKDSYLILCTNCNKKERIVSKHRQ